MEELVFVVKRSLLEKTGLVNHQGIKSFDSQYVEQSIIEHGQYIKRGDAEIDETYKQIIPYIILKNNDHYFLMQRSSNASEKRLAGNYSLGIGGHLRKEDILFKKIDAWGMREFNEEVAYNGTGTMHFIGILNDDSTVVGKVHLGLVFIYDAHSNKVSIKSELKSGILATKNEILTHFENLESWSKCIFTFSKTPAFSMLF